MEAVKQGILDAWANSPIRDKEGQNELRLMLKLLSDLHNNIRQVAHTGKLAQIEIERSKPKKALRSVGIY